MDAAVDREAERYPLSRNEAEWTIQMRSGERLKVKCLRDAFNHDAVRGQHVENVSLDIACGRYECRLTVPEVWSSGVDIHVAPPNLAESQRLFAELDDSFRSHALPWPFFWWSVASPIAMIIVSSIMMGLLAGMAVYSLQDKPDTTAHGKAFELRHEAQSIIEGGVSSENEHRAIELLLQIELYGERLPVTPAVVLKDRTFFTSVPVTLISLLAPFTILCFPPKTTIGMGKGRDKINRTRLWLRILSVWLPSFLVMGVLASIVGSIVLSRFSN